MAQSSIEEVLVVIDETLKELAGKSLESFVTEEEIEEYERRKRQQRETCLRKLLSVKATFIRRLASSATPSAGA